MRSAPAIILCLLTLGACSEPPPEHGAGANQIAESGKVPKTVKLAAAEILRRCKLPLSDRVVIFQWEAKAGETPYSLQLTRRELGDHQAMSCLNGEAKALGIDGEIDWAEEPPPPPN